MALEGLLSKALELPAGRLALLRCYYKTTSMVRWELLPDMSLRTA